MDSASEGETTAPFKRARSRKVNRQVTGDSPLASARAISRLTKPSGDSVEVDALLDAAEVVEATGGYLALRVSGDVGSQSVEFVVMKAPRRSPTQATGN